MTLRFLPKILALGSSVTISAFSQTIIPALPNVASLAGASAFNGDTVLVAGYVNAGDGGGGTFVFDATPDDPNTSADDPDGGLIFPRLGSPIHLAGATTNGSSAITVASTAKLVTGSPVSGSGIPVDAVIAAITNDTTFTLSTAATATGNPSLTITPYLGKWRRVTSSIDVRMFGAKGDGVTNDRNAIQAAIDAAESKGYESVHFGGLRYYVSDSSSAKLPFTEGDWAINPIYRRGILKIGFHKGAALPRLALYGEGSALYTDDERSGVTLTAQLGRAEYGGVPSVILVRAKLKSLVIQDLTIERKITGNRPAQPGNYQSYSEGIIGLLPYDKLHYYDHPDGENREGIFLFPNDDGSEVESIVFRNLTFIDCHRAFSTCGVPNFDYPKYSGKLVTLTVEDSRFLYPHGSSRYVDNLGYPHSGGGQATLLTPWVGTARILNNEFDGATSGDVSDNFSNTSVDGFVFGNPDRLICTGNKLRHFSVEGIIHFWFRALANTGGGVGIGSIVTGKSARINTGGAHELSTGDTVKISGVSGSSPDINGTYTVTVIDADTFTIPVTIFQPGAGGVVDKLVQMPAIGGTMLARVGGGHIPSWVQDGLRVYLGHYLGDASPVPSAGFMQIVNPEDGARQVILRNLGGPANASPGTLLNLNSNWLMVPDSGADASSVISNNEIDCSPVAGYKLPPASGYGSPAIRVEDVKATITSNNIINAPFGIVLSDSAWSEDRMRGSIVANNRIALADSRDPRLAGKILSGITTNANGITIESNNITVPVAQFSNGITLLSSDNKVSNNVLVAELRDSSTVSAWGILFGNGMVGNVASGNSTKNFHIGAGPYLPQESIFTILDHTSLGDGQGVVISPNALYSKQSVNFTPADAGWYRILRGPINEVSGGLEIYYRDAVGQHMDAHLRLDFSSYSSFRNLVQESFNSDPTLPPVVDKLALYGDASPEVFVHVTRPVTTPVKLVFDTEVPGAQIFEKPEFQAGTVTKIETYLDGSNHLAKVDFASQHHLPGPPWGIYLFDLPNSARLNDGHLIKSVPSPSQLIVSTLDSTPSAQVYTGPFSYFSTSGNTSVGSDGAKVLTFSKNGSKSLAGYGVLQGSTIAGVAPEFIGQNFLNTSTGEWFIATGLLETDWKKVLLNDATVAFGSSILSLSNLNGGGTGQLQPGGGSVGIDGYSGADNQPGYGFNGDDDTGIYHPADNTIAFATDGAERMRIENPGVTISGAATVSGSLGIGGGMTIKKVIRFSSRVSIGAVESLNSEVVSVTNEALSGVTAGDTVILNFDPSSQTSVRVFYTAWVPAEGGKVLIRASNPSAGRTGSLAPKFYITVISYGP